MTLTRLAFFKLGLIVGLGLTVAASATEDSRGWAVIYKQTEVNPNMVTAVYCADHRPDCNTVYMDVETTKWFPTREDALDFINGFYVEAGLASGPLSKTDLSGNPVAPKPMAADRIIGIYKCERIPIRLHRVGSHKVTVQEPREVERDIQEWRPQ